MSHAAALIRCSHESDRVLRPLFQNIFEMRWCYRPQEMTEPRHDVASNSTVDVCVWSPETPKPPPQCR